MRGFSFLKQGTASVVDGGWPMVKDWPMVDDEKRRRLEPRKSEQD
jgi:hypothetical protein